jgi:hypothetical protein
VAACVHEAIVIRHGRDALRRDASAPNAGNTICRPGAGNVRQSRRIFSAEKKSVAGFRISSLHARISRTAWPFTSVRRKSRPP